MDFHNDFLKKAYHTARGLPAEYLRHPVPDEDEFMSNKVNLKEVSASDYIVPYEAQSRYEIVYKDQFFHYYHWRDYGFRVFVDY